MVHEKIYKRSDGSRVSISIKLFTYTYTDHEYSVTVTFKKKANHLGLIQLGMQYQIG